MALLHQLALSCLPGIGPVLARNLLSYCGDAEHVFKAKRKHLAQIPGIGPKTLEHLTNNSALKRAEHELKFIDKFKINALFITDEEYPKRLRNCADAPVTIYFKGNANLNAAKVIIHETCHVIQLKEGRPANESECYGKDSVIPWNRNR
jgi:DNA processing protein